MTTTLELIQAWKAIQSAGREIVTDQGLPCQVTEGTSVSHYTWTAGELTGIVEPDGCRWDYSYGGDGRLLTVDINGRRWADYGYDTEGRLITVSRQDNSLAHAYDERGRLVRTLRGDASPFLFKWDDHRVTSARSNREECRFHHDAQGRVVGLEQRVDEIALSVRSTFDENDRLSQLEFPEWRQRVNFGWDERGRPATIAWNDRVVSLFGTDDDSRLFWSEGIDGLREETWHETTGGRPTCKVISQKGQEIWRCELVRDDAFRLMQEGTRTYTYDASGRLSEAQDVDHHWKFHQDVMDHPLTEEDIPFNLERDSAGRVSFARQGSSERVFRHNQASEMLEALVDGNRVARCLYDHKGRLVLKTGSKGTERYIYGADDGLLAIADGEGRPLLIYLRLPIGVVGMIDFRTDPDGEPMCLHCDVHGNLVFTSTADGNLEGPFASDPFGSPLRLPENIPYLYRGRLWHPEMGLYRIGCRWYDPNLRQFLTPDTHTGAPDDERLINPFRKAETQRMARVQILGDWLKEPRLRNGFVYCANDPVNRFDPDGHWSFGGVMLSLLGVLWTLPNTVFGLAVEVTCLLGEVVRWLVWLFSGGNASWQTPGFDAAASGNLNAFALVFKGGWLGSFESLLGITFGNVIIVNGEYQNSAYWQALPDPLTPTAYGGSVTIPKSQALYEHELRHVNQYGWWGPFFHLGLPLFGVYEWDVILNGYQNADLEKDARAHGGI